MLSSFSGLFFPIVGSSTHFLYSPPNPPTQNSALISKNVSRLYQISQVTTGRWGRGQGRTDTPIAAALGEPTADTVRQAGAWT